MAMAVTKVVLRLARNPGYPNGDPEQGYVIVAPLDADGRLDPVQWRANRKSCTVVRFKPGTERDADGWLSHHGSRWYIRYDEESEGDDEPVFRLGDHSLNIGDYITIHENDGEDMTYRVTEHAPVRDPANS